MKLFREEYKRKEDSIVKKIFIYLLVCNCLVASVLPLAGCGVKEKVAKAAGEKIVEKALGDKVDIDGDEVTIKGDNGEEATIGGGQWPDSELTRKLPEFKKGNIVSSLKTEDTVTITMEKVKAEDLSSYLEEIKKAYPKDSNESEADGLIMYSGSGEDNISASIYFAEGDGTLIITVAKTEQ